MIVNRGAYSLFAVMVLVFGGQTSFAGILDELSPADQMKVKNGEQVAVYVESGKPGAPWPICKIYQKIDAMPIEAAAVFHDYEIHSKFIPGVVKSHVARHQKGVADVDYELKLPMGMGGESYTCKDMTSSYDGGASFRVDWTVYPTETILESVGNARFEKMGYSTVMAYTNFLHPNRWGTNLNWVKERAKKQVRDTVTAIANQVQTETTDQPDLLKEQIRALNDDLN